MVENNDHYRKCKATYNSWPQWKKDAADPIMRPRRDEVEECQMPEPTEKQIRLVNYILEYNRSLERPPFTKHDYWLFIRDHQYAWKRPRYEPDEDDLYLMCTNDIWCEEY